MVLRVMGAAFLLAGIVFFIIGFLLLQVLDMLAKVTPALSKSGVVINLSGLNTLTGFGWIFAVIIFMAGIFSIMAAVLLFKTKEE